MFIYIYIYIYIHTYMYSYTYMSCGRIRYEAPFPWALLAAPRIFHNFGWLLILGGQRGRERRRDGGVEWRVANLTTLSCSILVHAKSWQHPKVFPGGPPPQYWPGPAPLNFGGRKRSGAFDAVWPSAITLASAEIVVNCNWPSCWPPGRLAGRRGGHHPRFLRSTRGGEANKQKQAHRTVNKNLPILSRSASWWFACCHPPGHI